MKLRVATCQALPEPDIDAAPLAAALASAGFDAQLVAWDDPAADWDARIPTILRSTWNYALDVTGFLGWIDRVSASATLINPRDVIRGNVRKRYLLELAARGVPVTPTTLVEPGDEVDLVAIAAKHRAARLVIKPEVGAGSLQTEVFAPDDPAATLHIATIAARSAVLIQPYVDSVDGYGERSLVWIDGALSHAIRKSPRFAGHREAVQGPLPIADDERALAELALGPIARDILYGRVDLARDENNRAMVMELELVEPSLFFMYQPGSAERYVAGLRRRLGGS